MESLAVGAIDLHCHLLPGIDDGAADWETTLAMARLAVADGIGTIVVTPHWPLDGGGTDGPVVRELTAEAQERLREAEVPLHLFPGHELQISHDLVTALAAGRALPLADSRFILLETPYFALPPYLRDLVFRLQSHGYLPILAHPERNPTVQHDPRCLESLVDAGCLLQVNAGSVLGHFGPPSRRAAEKLLARGWVDLMASDAHGAAVRPPLLAAAVRAAARTVGMEAAQSLVGASPFAIVQGLMPPALRLSRESRGLPAIMARLRGRA
jgi:protein-tyrosine phosphatase